MKNIVKKIKDECKKNGYSYKTCLAYSKSFYIELRKDFKQNGKKYFYITNVRFSDHDGNLWGKSHYERPHFEFSFCESENSNFNKNELKRLINFLKKNQTFKEEKKIIKKIIIIFMNKKKKIFRFLKKKKNFIKYKIKKIKLLKKENKNETR